MANEGEKAEAETPPKSCPTPTAHKRLEEVHHFWHECLNHYQSPRFFRTNLNACIQALRNVTFVLQKEKRLISDFDDWYPVWQAKMAADPVMKWVVSSRNRIVKAGDLETNSVLRASIVAFYEDAASAVEEDLASLSGNHPKFTVAAPVRSSLDEILAKFKSIALPPAILDDATLVIERRWEDSALPGRELLDALAHAYGVLSELLADAHERAGIKHGVAVKHGHEVVEFESKYQHGRLPCMLTTRSSRTLSIELSDIPGSKGPSSWSGIPEPPDVDQLPKRRAKRMQELASNWGPAESLLDLVPRYTEIATEILKSGEEHGWFVFYFRGKMGMGTKVLAAKNRAGKRELALEIAEDVLINEFDGLIMIGEVWWAPITPDEHGVPIAATLHPERQEALMIHAEQSDGSMRAIILPFSRRWRRVKIGEPIEESGAHYVFMEPVRAVWRSWNANTSPTDSDTEDVQEGSS
ncbi:hypothetical protein OHA10_29420 [Kribbella sp. NBC_00662]|uniref:hypothetical protein n=1 Tax=Kribbella sp. NBC_00662 TaxID=2975969 RepID=UPI00324D0B92